MIYVLGGYGFVGSGYLRLFAAAGVAAQAIDRENYEALRGTACDVLVNANGNSRKLLATREPLRDFDASVRSVAASLEDFSATRYVFLSSGDVYPDASSAAATQEDQRIDLGRVSRYGLHKQLAEQLVQAVHPRWLVVRKGGFVGPGLKKNAVGAEGEVVNLGAEGRLCLGDLHRRVGSASAFRPDAPTLRYELSLERLRGLVAGPLPRTQECVHAFADAVRDHRIVLG